MDVILTEHASRQMELRYIDENQIVTAIKRGSKTRQTNGWLSVYCCIAVAYKITRNNKYKIKTVMIV